MTQPLDLQSVPTTLRFEPAEHRYFLDDAKGTTELPGVTRTLERAGLIDFSMVPHDVLENARVRGTRIHQALHYLDDGDLDADTVEESDHPYLMAWARAKRDLDIEILVVEQMIWSPVHRYAGRFDRIVTLKRKDGGRDKALLDFKTGQVLPAHKLQLAAYVGPLPDPRTYRRIALELHDDSSFRVIEFPPEEFQRDLQIFTGLVAAEWWKRAHGI